MTYQKNNFKPGSVLYASQLNHMEDGIFDAVNKTDGVISTDLFSSILHKTPKVSILKDYYNLQRNGKVYQTKIWKFAANPTSAGEKLLDNAGLQFEPSTDATEGKDDYLNGNHPLFEWCYCDYLRNEDGSPYPVATEYEDGYKTSGAVDVGAMQMSFYWNWDASNSEYDLVTISDSPNEKYGLKPWTECKKADGTVLPWCIGSAYVSGLGSDGKLHSQPNLKPELFQSHNNMVTNYGKKGKGHQGAGAERNSFQILFNIIKGATKNSQSLFQGCSNYNFQYSASIESTESHTYFPVTNAQANNIIVGSCVSVGYGVLDSAKTGVNNDRGNLSIHKYANMVKVLKIETLDSNNKAIYLDIENGFNTSKIKLSDTVSAPIILSSMPWWSGTTNKVIGRHDGSLTSNTNSKFPYRVQGREYMIGCYIVASDTVMFFNSDYSKNVYVAQKGIDHSTNETVIKANYKMIGVIPASSNGKGGDYWIGDVSIDSDTGAWYPSAQGSSNSQGMSDMLYAGGATASGNREYLMGGGLGHGSLAGSSYLGCGGGLGGAYWHFGGCD